MTSAQARQLETDPHIAATAEDGETAKPASSMWSRITQDRWQNMAGWSAGLVLCLVVVMLSASVWRDLFWPVTTSWIAFALLTVALLLEALHNHLDTPEGSRSCRAVGVLRNILDQAALVTLGYATLLIAIWAIIGLVVGLAHLLV